ncbi:phosphatase PAP2 family protein [Aureibaculum flavum]|nr:phosphatase PAP2 family protein [Aureibaculum flavum]
MDLLDQILEYDKELIVYLNNWGSEPWDSFWMFITNQFSWIPLFLLLFYFIFKSYGWKKGLILVLVAAGLVAFSDQFVNLIKNNVARLRPNNDPTVNELIRILKKPRGYSFVSGHSTTSFAVTTFMILTLRKYYKYPFLLLGWPLLFAYSRIYIGVHFPIDIFMGMLLGITIGLLFYKISIYFLKKVNSN